MNVTVIYYEQGTPADEIAATAHMVADMLEDHKIIAIPKQFDLLLNCSPDQLIMTRNIIDVALAEKLNSMTPVGDSQQENQSWGGKVIDITKYLN